MDDKKSSKKMSLADLDEVIKNLWYDSVDFSKPPSLDNMYISLQEGWSSNGENKYWMFAATIPSRGLLMTGRGGFILFIQDWGDKMVMPIVYNGLPLPSEQFKDFIEYCKDERIKSK